MGSPQAPRLLRLLARSSALLLVACSGAFTGAATDGGTDDSVVSSTPTSDEPTPSTPSTPSPSGSSTGSAPPDASAQDASSSDSATDGPCVEPEPNGAPTAPARLPPNFTCGRIDQITDVDHYTYTTKSGETTVRFTASPAAFAPGLRVIVRRAGTTLVFGAGDTLSGLTAGSNLTFEVSAMEVAPISYGIVFGP